MVHQLRTQRTCRKDLIYLTMNSIKKIANTFKDYLELQDSEISAGPDGFTLICKEVYNYPNEINFSKSYDSIKKEKILYICLYVYTRSRLFHKS